MRFDIETQASPEQVHQALTDFTQERLHIWNRTLDPKTYEVLSMGPTGPSRGKAPPGRRSGFVARYDWSDPSVVRWTVVESSYGGSGQGFVRIVPRDGGGSRLHAEWVNTEPRRQEAHAPSAAPRPRPDGRRCSHP